MDERAKKNREDYVKKISEIIKVGDIVTVKEYFTQKDGSVNCIVAQGPVMEITDLYYRVAGNISGMFVPKHLCSSREKGGFFSVVSINGIDVDYIIRLHDMSYTYNFTFKSIEWTDAYLTGTIISSEARVPFRMLLLINKKGSVYIWGVGFNSRMSFSVRGGNCDTLENAKMQAEKAYKDYVQTQFLSCIKEHYYG